MDRLRFEQLVEEALDTLPPFFQEKLENIGVLVESLPDRETQESFPGGLLLGLYRGVPHTQRSIFEPFRYPDLIFIYQRNIERICRTGEEIRQQVRHTVIHEIGHHFGLNDEELRQLEEEG